MKENGKEYFNVVSTYSLFRPMFVVHGLLTLKTSSWCVINLKTDREEIKEHITFEDSNARRANLD
jgi:hypothetical protein